jgi:hypothetical protein
LKIIACAFTVVVAAKNADIAVQIYFTYHSSKTKKHSRRLSGVKVGLTAVTMVVSEEKR